MEASKSANTGYKRESSLYQEVRERLEQGTLPSAPRQVRVGRATRQQTCVVCQRVIRPGKIQNESILGGGVKAYAHGFCLCLWVDASRVVKGSDAVR